MPQASCVDDGILTHQLPGKAERGSRNLASAPRLRGETEHVGCCKSRRENRVVLGSKFLNCGRVGAAVPEGRRSGFVVDSFAQPFQGSGAREARESLSDGGKRKVPEVIQTPEALTALLDPLAD